MKIQVISDVHITSWQRRFEWDESLRLGAMGNWFESVFLPEIQTDADILVCAGDTVSLAPADQLWTQNRFFEICSRYRNMVFVSGNHEFYGTTIPRGLERLYEIEKVVPGLVVLKPGELSVVQGVKFLGGTMFQPKPPPGDEANFNLITDHYMIGDFKNDAPVQYREFRDGLHRLCDADTVVVTHHAPSLKSLDSRFAGSHNNYWFITDQIEPTLEECHPRLWIHGHVHTPFRYWINGITEVIANPHGYAGEGVRFDPKLVVEVP